MKEWSELYTTPDGEHGLYKTMMGAYAGGKLGLILGAYDVVGISKPPGLIPKLMKLGVRTSEPLLMGAIYGSMVTISSHLRGGKDDEINHFIGGASMATVLGMKTKPIYGFHFALVLGTLFAAVKHAKLCGFEFIPDELPIKKWGIVGNNESTTGGPIRKYEEPTHY